EGSARDRQSRVPGVDSAFQSRHTPGRSGADQPARDRKPLRHRSGFSARPVQPDQPDGRAGGDGGMSGVPARISPREQRSGGIAGYPLDALRREVAFIAYHFNWPPADILEFEHVERRQWVSEISAINREMNGD